MLGNYPDTSIPLSTDTTVTPDATPTDTSSINVSTSTDFKGKLEGEPGTGVVRVTDAHPAGTYTGDGDRLQQRRRNDDQDVTLTVTTPVTCIPVNFAAAASFSAGTTPHSIAVGDFNGDGKQDLAVADELQQRVGLARRWRGRFQRCRQASMAGNNPESVAVGDFNGDGKEDLAVANLAQTACRSYWAMALAASVPTANFDTGVNAGFVAVGDFNDDGKQDLAVCQLRFKRRIDLVRRGTGSFGATHQLRCWQ